MAKLSNVVKNEVVKKTDYNTLKSKVDGIDVSKYAGRTKYESDGKAIYDKIDKVEKKIPVLNDFFTTARFNILLLKLKKSMIKLEKVLVIFWGLKVG